MDQMTDSQMLYALPFTYIFFYANMSQVLLKLELEIYYVKNYKLPNVKIRSI